MSPDDFQHLNLTLEEGGLLLCRLEHGKANECGSDVIGELEQLATLVRTRPEITALVTYSERVTRSGKPVFIAGANVTERTGWTDLQVKAHVRRQRAALLALRDLPILHVAVAQPFFAYNAMRMKPARGPHTVQSKKHWKPGRKPFDKVGRRLNTQAVHQIQVLEIWVFSRSS